MITFKYLEPRMILSPSDGNNILFIRKKDFSTVYYVEYTAGDRIINGKEDQYNWSKFGMPNLEEATEIHMRKFIEKLFSTQN